MLGNQLLMNPAIVGLQATILVVEDNEPFLDFVTSTLRQLPNFQVVGEARNGFEAVRQAEALQPDLILLDVGLPGLNGIQAAHRIRKLASHARIVFLSQESAPDIVREAFSLGARAYVLKAHASRDLPLALEAVMGGKQYASSGLDAGVVTISG